MHARCLLFDNESVLRVLVVAEEGCTLLEEGLGLRVGACTLLLGEDVAENFQQLWHAVRQGHQAQFVQFLIKRPKCTNNLY